MKHLRLLLILVTAFALRLGVRLRSGETNFWNNGYSAYFDMAESVAAGKGFCLDGMDCGRWPPVYPAFLSLTVPRRKAFIRIAVIQSALGAGTAACAVLIAAYYVVHDTALQETSSRSCGRATRSRSGLRPAPELH